MEGGEGEFNQLKLRSVVQNKNTNFAFLYRSIMLHPK